MGLGEKSCQEEMYTVQPPAQFKASAWLKKANTSRYLCCKVTGLQTTIKIEQNIRVVAVACNYDGGDAAFVPLKHYNCKSQRAAGSFQRL